MAKVKRNENGKPVLQKNTISQAQKPTKAKPTLPAAPTGILPSLDDIDRLEALVKDKTNTILHLENQLSALTDRLEKAHEKIVAQSRVLARMGIGSPAE